MPDTKECPFCLSTIPSAATKCRHCGEWVDGRQQSDQPDQSDQSLGRFFESDDLDETLNVGIKWYVKYRIAMAIVGLILFLILLPTFGSTMCAARQGPDFGPGPQFGPGPGPMFEEPPVP